MKQKIFSLISALLLSAGMIQAAILNGTCGDNLTWVLNTQDSTLTIEGSGQMASNPWTEYRNYIAYISLPEELTNIYRSAFIGCCMKSITIPQNVTSIGFGALAQCHSLTTINVAETNQNYSSYEGVLFNKSQTTLIQYPNGRQGAYTIPSSVTCIEENSFERCSKLTSIIIPDGVLTINGCAFEECSNLVSVTIPNSVTSIGGSAFAWCENLTSIIIGNGVVSIGNSAFCNCPNLRSITIPNSVTSIGSSVFINCYRLSSVSIGESVTCIKGNTFMYCGNLNTIDIPNSVKTIEFGAFYQCYNLKTLTIGSGVTEIGEHAFLGNNNLSVITCSAITPPTLGREVFNGVDKSIPLFVPQESVNTYKNTIRWEDFTNIYAIGTVIGTYRVEFHDMDGTILKVDSVNYGSSATAPANPYRQGYTFIGWNVDFSNITSDLIVTAQYELGEEKDFTIIFANGNDNNEILIHNVILKVPAAPEISGFTFIGWRPVAAIIDSNTIEIEAVYQADEQSTIPSVVTNPTNPAQKLIRNGNVYILRDNKLYTITGNVL